MGLFDDFAKEYGEDEAESSDPAVDQVIQELDDEEIDDELREAEKRLSKAAYYKVIVRNGVIEEDGTAEAAEINAEARFWARKMMVKLLKGTDPDEPKQVPVESPFNEREILVLKKIIEKVLLAQGEKPVDPVVKKVPTQPVTPQVKTIKTNKPPTPGKPPAKKPPQTPPAAAAAKPPKNAPKKPFKPKVNPNGELDYDNIPTGEMFKDKDGQFYKYVPHPQEDNTRIKIKVTGQVRNPQALPMPSSKQQMEAISHSQATASINTGAPGNTNFPDLQSAGTDMLVAAAATAMNRE